MSFFGGNTSTDFTTFENSLWGKINPNNYESVNTAIIINLLKSSLLTPTQLAATWDFMFKGQQTRAFMNRTQFSTLLKLVAGCERDIDLHKIDLNASFQLPTFKSLNLQEDEWNVPDAYMDDIADKYLPKLTVNNFGSSNNLLLNGQDVRNLIQTEQLVIPNMTGVWSLFDCDGDGKLDEVEFVAFFAFCKYMLEKNLTFSFLLPVRFLKLIRTGPNMPPRKYKKKAFDNFDSTNLIFGGGPPTDSFQQLSLDFQTPQTQQMNNIPKVDSLAHSLEYYVNLFKTNSGKVSASMDFFSGSELATNTNENEIKIENVQKVFNEFNLSRTDKAEVWDAFNLPHKKTITFAEYMAIVRKLNEKLTLNKLFEEKNTQCKSVQNTADLSPANMSLFEEFLRLKSEMIVLKEMNTQHSVFMNQVNDNKRKTAEVDGKIANLQKENEKLKERLTLLEQNHNSLLKMVDDLNMLASEQNSLTSQDFNSKMFGIKSNVAPLIEQKNKLLKSETSTFNNYSASESFQPTADPFSAYNQPDPFAVQMSQPLQKVPENDPFAIYNKVGSNNNVQSDPFAGFAQPNPVNNNNDVYDPFA